MAVVEGEVMVPEYAPIWFCDQDACLQCRRRAVQILAESCLCCHPRGCSVLWR